MSSKQSSASQSCAVPCVGAFVCAVPAALPQVSMAAPQPMQVWMMAAPMSAPFMMPQQQDSSFAPGSMDYGSFAGGQYQWPANSAWPYHCAQGQSFGEEAPQQLPMMMGGWSGDMGGMAGWSAQTWGKHAENMGAYFEEGKHAEEEVPAQIEMGSTMMQPRSADQVHTKATLRRRKGQECTTQQAYTQECNFGSFPETNQDQDDLDASEAEARSIANGLLEQFEAGGDSQESALASFERLAFTSKTSSRAAQMVLNDASSTGAVAFAAGLRGHVRSAVQSKHANHVIQKITEVMPVARSSFVVDELKGFAHEVVRHNFGCRVMCRILEHLSLDDLSTIQLVEEVLAGDLRDLCYHSFGSYVVRHILEFGLPAHKQLVVRVLIDDVAGFAKDKFGSHVLEAALQHASLEDKQLLTSQLLEDKEQLVFLAQHQFGRHVVRALLAKMPRDLKREAAAALQPFEAQLKGSRFGKSVLQLARAASSA